MEYLNKLQNLYQKNEKQFDIANWILLVFVFISILRQPNSPGELFLGTSCFYVSIYLILLLPIFELTQKNFESRMQRYTNETPVKISELFLIRKKKNQWNWVILNGCMLYLFYFLIFSV